MCVYVCVSLSDSLIATWFTVHSNMQYSMTDSPARVYGCFKTCVRLCVCVCPSITKRHKEGVRAYVCRRKKEEKNECVCDRLPTLCYMQVRSPSVYSGFN